MMDRHIRITELARNTYNELYEIASGHYVLNDNVSYSRSFLVNAILAFEFPEQEG